MQRHQRLCLLLNYILFLLLLSSTAVNGRQVVSFKKNLEQVMSKRMCKEPQQRLVYLEDEYEQYQVGAVYLPPAALVHRCDKSVGCCPVSHQQCSVAVEELVTFVFEEIIRGRKRKKEIVLTNHVRCQCRSVSWDAPR